MKKHTRRLIALLAAFCVAFTSLPMLSGSFEASAATSYLKKLTGTAASETSIKLSWTKLTTAQKKKVTGITIFRNGKSIKNVSKASTSFTNTGLKAGTSYTYQVKTYKTKKVTQWYNKKTKKWQTKKPAKKYRGKSRKVTTYTYSNASPKVTVKTKGTFLTAPSVKASVSGNGVTLTWAEVANAEGYYVFRDGKFVDQVSYEEYADTVTAGTYVYTVAAFNGSTKAVSKEVTVTVESTEQGSGDDESGGTGDDTGNSESGSTGNSGSGNTENTSGDEEVEYITYTDYLGKERKYTAAQAATLTESELARVNRDYNGEFTYYNLRMRNVNGVTFNMDAIENPTIKQDIYGAYNYTVEMYNGNPDLLVFDPQWGEVEVKPYSTYKKTGATYEPITYPKVMFKNGLGIGRVYTDETTDGNITKKTIKWYEEGNGFGFAAADVPVIVRYDGTEIGRYTLHINPDADEMGLSPFRHACYEIAMEAIEANGGKKSWKEDLRTIIKYLEANYVYEQKYENIGYMDCISGASILEAFSTIEYNEPGFLAGSPLAAPGCETSHVAFHPNSNPSAYYDAQGHHVSQ